MRSHKWLVLAVVLTSAVLLTVLIVQASSSGQQPGARGGSQGDVSAQGTLGTSFTYQGELKSGGGPVSGNCDMAFRLYDGESGGSQVGSAITTTVPVSDGLFTVNLDFGGAAFTGDARWLELAVRCPAGSGAYDTLAPRQPLSPAPYAMHATTAKQLVEVFVVASGESVSAGDVVSFLGGEIYGPSEEWGPESTFNADYTSFIAVSALSATEVVVAYQDFGNASYGTAVIGTVSGGTVSWGPESAFNMTSTSQIAISALSATEFVVAYTDGGNSDHGTAIVGTISGGAVSWGRASEFNTAPTGYVAVSALSATEFVVVYQDVGNANYGTAIVGTVSGGSPRWGAEQVFNPAGTGHVAVSALSASDFVVAYGRYFPTIPAYYGGVIVGTVSGGAVNWGGGQVV